jgi:hypothetical protein
MPRSVAVVITTLALVVAAPALAQAPAGAAPAKAAAVLTVDSTLRDLVLDPRTRPVIARHMPGFPERIESDPQLAEMFGGITLVGLQHDPHVQGMTPEALAKFAAELAEAQKPAG